MKKVLWLVLLALIPLGCKSGGGNSPSGPGSTLPGPTATPTDTQACFVGTSPTCTWTWTQSPTRTLSPTNTHTWTNTRTPTPFCGAPGSPTCTPVFTATRTWTFTPTSTFTFTPVPTPGKHWILVASNPAFSPRYNHAAVVFNNQMWVIAGQDANGMKGDVWRSPDGLNWTQVNGAAEFGPREHPSVAVFDAGTGARMWLAGGNTVGTDRDVWSSADGITWTRATTQASPGTWLRHLVVHDDGSGSKLWSLGEDAQVFRSGNGVDWQSVTGNASYGNRSMPAVLEHNSQMIVVGGYSSMPSSDVYTSTDGITWTAQTAGTFQGRWDHVGLSYLNRLWVLWGSGAGSVPQTDVWYMDGGSWTQAAVTTSTGALTYSAGVVFNSSMWVIGGHKGGFGFTNEVWRSP